MSETGAAIASLMAKDLRLLLRDRGAVFLTFAWPLVLAIFFGALGPGFGAALDTDPADGGAAGGGTLTVVAVDDDRSEASAALLAQLDADPMIIVELSDAGLDDARARVRQGEEAAYINLAPGFGAHPSPLLDPAAPAIPAVELGVDPRRRPEAEVLAGATKLAAWRALAETLPGAGAQHELRPGSLDAVEIRYHSVGASQAEDPGSASASKPPSPYAVTFPQGIIWAVLACAATFAVSLVEERKRGTLLRLAVAPVSRLTILAGKAGACLVAIVFMELVLLAIAVLGFGVRPESPGLLALALAATAFGFVGLMTLLAVLGRRTQSAAGLSWAILMSMAMLGGGMLPLFLMPSWLVVAANASPVAWALYAIEGAVWRGLSLSQLALPCAGLGLLGVASLIVGARAVRDL